MQLRPHEIALGIVRGDIAECDGAIPHPRSFFTHEEAIAFLEDFTGESFGSDAESWTRWFSECPSDLLDDFATAYNNLMHSPKGRYFREICESANARWENTTERRCPNCNTRCPEYREHCYACRHVLGRG